MFRGYFTRHAFHEQHDEEGLYGNKCACLLHVVLWRPTCQVDGVLMILNYFHRLVQHSCFSPEVIALGLCTIEPKIAPVEDHTYVLDERDVARSRPCVSRLKSNTLATARVLSRHRSSKLSSTLAIQIPIDFVAPFSS